MAAARPAVAQDDARVLRFVPQGQLANLDPIFASSAIARTHGYLIWDTLYGRTTRGGVSPQMAAGHDVSADGRVWRFGLREGLFFHDGEPVLAQDCVASVRRWARKRPFGQKLLAQTVEMRVLDDASFSIRLSRPFPRMLEALAADTCFMMPERVSRTEPDVQISDLVGSGPFRFENDEFVAGSRAVYTRFEKYDPVPRPADFTAGAKQARFERVEWLVPADPAAAIGRGEVDWWQTPPLDQLAGLRATAGVKLAQLDPVGVMAVVALNHLQPPFDNPAVRRALLPALDQSAYVAAAMGGGPGAVRDVVGVFTLGQPCAGTAGLAVLAAPRDPARARGLLAEAGYRQEPVVLLAPSDNPHLGALAGAAAAQFAAIGLNLRVQTMSWVELMARRAIQAGVDQGGWSAFCTTFEGLTVASPASHLPLRGTGTAGWFGWPTSPRLEGLRDAWFDADGPASQRAICDDIQRTALEEVAFLPAGQWYATTALRTSLAELVRAPFPIFWNVRRV